MRRRQSVEIGAVGLGVATLLGTTACSGSQPKPEACVITAPASPVTQVVMQGLARSLNRCYQAAPETNQIPESKPPHTIGLIIPTHGGGKVVVEAQSAKSLSENHLPDPMKVEAVSVAEYPDGNLQHHSSVNLDAYKRSGGVNSSWDWNMYWQGQAGDSPQSVAVVDNAVQIDKFPKVTSQPILTDGIRVQIGEEMQAVAGILPGDPMPQVDPPVYK